MANVINLPTYEQVEGLKEVINSQYSIDGKVLTPLFSSDVREIKISDYPDEDYILLTDKLLTRDYNNNLVIGLRDLDFYQADINTGKILKKVRVSHSTVVFVSPQVQYEGGFCYHNGCLWTAVTTSGSAVHMILIDFNNGTSTSLGNHLNTVAQFLSHSPWIFDAENNCIYASTSGYVFRFMRPFESMPVATTSVDGYMTVKLFVFTTHGFYIANGNVYVAGRNASNHFYFHILDPLTLVSKAGSYSITTALSGDQILNMYPTEDPNIVLAVRGNGAVFGIDLTGVIKPGNLTTTLGIQRSAMLLDIVSKKAHGFLGFNANTEGFVYIDVKSYTINSDLTVSVVKNRSIKFYTAVNGFTPFNMDFENMRFKVATKNSTSNMHALGDYELVYQVAGYIEKR